MKHSIKYVLGFLVTAFAVIALPWCLATMASCTPPKPKPYHGYNVPPYVESKHIDHMITGCGATTCDAQVYVAPVVHNPSFFRLDGVLICEYMAMRQKWVVKKHVKMAPRTSLRVELTKSITIPMSPPTTIDVVCYYRYAKRRIGR